jgi:hypothetical protein
MEPTMISLKVWSTAAAIALAMPMATMTANVAAARGGGGHGGIGGAHFGGGAAHFGGGAAHFGGGAAHVGGGGWHGGGFRRGGGFIPGAVIGGAIATAPYGYYGGPGYYYGPAYDSGYYDDQYYDQEPVVAAPAPAGEDAVAWCMQTYRSYAIGQLSRLRRLSPPLPVRPAGQRKSEPDSEKANRAMRLAREIARFGQCIAQGRRTAPSRFSLPTGGKI